MHDIDYAMEVLKRSAPRERPRLPAEYEEMFRPSDLARAECYAGLEHMTERLDAIVEALDEEDAVVVGVNEGDSLVHHIEIALGSQDG